MQSRWHRCFVVGTLLMAAFSVHVDVPRLHLLASMGDTLNAIRVADPVSHILLARMADRRPGDDELDEALKEGRESLELLVHTPAIDAILPPGLLPRFASDAEPLRFDNGGDDLFTLTGLAGNLRNIDLPPPRLEQSFEPPRLEMPGSTRVATCARAPPLAMR